MFRHCVPDAGPFLTLPNSMMSDDTLAYTPPRDFSHLAAPWILWGVLTAAAGLFSLLHDRSPTGFLMEVAVFTLICGIWFIGMLTPPTLSVTREGIGWKRRWRSPVVIPWEEITELRAAEKIRTYRGGDYVVCHLHVTSPGRKIHIRTGPVVDTDDMRTMVRMIDEAIRRFGIGIVLRDPDGIMIAAKGMEEIGKRPGPGL